MNNNENDQRDETLKLVVFVLLAFFLPLFGIGFAIYILSYAKIHPIEQWFKNLAIIALVFQSMPVILAVIAIASFTLAA